MKREKTAVEFLYEFVQLKLTNEQQMQFEGLFHQAKQMEKEQIEEAAKSCNYIGGATDQEAEDYYESKYDKDETQGN